MESIKDQWSKKINATIDSKGEKGHSNWVEGEEAVKIIKKVLERFPEAIIEFNGEHFIITRKNGSQSYVPRHHQIKTSSDGKRITGKTTVEDMIFKILEKDQE
ncbi:MAG TPA: hypothetical protein PK367_02585 [Candidatus Paceibacterota bacterium]|nr:hypothetical protein [Candidatus Paceibacterota bacterium]